MPSTVLDEEVHARHGRSLVSDPPGPAGLLARRWADLERAQRVLLGLVAAVVLLRVGLYPGTAGTPVYGDEAYYVDAARALSNLVRDLVSFSGPDTAELSQNVAGNGWFMPGMSILLTPLFVVVPDAPIELVRAYLGLASTALLLLAVLGVRRHLGRVPAGAVLVVPGLVPMYAVFGFAAYGDLVAGLLVLMLLTQAVALVRRTRAADRGAGPEPVATWRHGIHLGSLAIAAVYFRSSVSILVVGLLGTALLVGVLLARGQWRRLVATMLAAGAAFVVLLAPWSAYASHELGGRVLTTTSVPTVLANTFGDRDDVCYGECDPGSSIWFSPLRYSREVARATGISEMQAAAEMSVYARADVTAESYARDVLDNLSRYLRNPAGFARIFESPTAPYPTAEVVGALTYLMAYPAFLVGLVMLLYVDRRGAGAQVQSLLVKVAIGALLVQPFVHIAGSRYWMTLGPLLGLSAALLYGARRSRGRPVAGDVATLAWLTRLQVVLVVGAVTAATVVVALAV